MSERIEVNCREAFGNLVFLGCDPIPVKETVNNREVNVGYKYHLVSDVQADVDVIVPMSAGRIDLDFQTPVEIVNPVIGAVGKRSRNVNYIDWECYADGIRAL